MQLSRPIGVFDSGVGGLTVVKSLMERLPNEQIIYFGDTARVPYGVKSVEAIRHFSGQIAQFLLKKKVKMLVIACNTIAAVATEHIKKIAENLLVLNVIESGAKAATLHTCNHAIGVMATLATITSGAYTKAIHKIQPNCRIYSQICPLFVPLVEEGLLNHPATELIAREYLQFIKNELVDTLLLGCTHYPLLTPLLKQLTDERLYWVDPALATAEDVAVALKASHLLNPSQEIPEHQFYVSDIPLQFQVIAEQFLGYRLPKLQLARLD
jgi:glutamate racemase